MAGGESRVPESPAHRLPHGTPHRQGDKTGEQWVAGRYRLEGKIGEGGMGVVWRAYDELLHRTVAIKQVVFPRGLPQEGRKEIHARILREARSAARLSHPGIVSVYDVIEEEGDPWIIMQLIEAPDLGTQLRTRGLLTVTETARLGLQLLDALTEAHSAGICHRDIKPSNVLMAPRGPVLVDFGIALIDGATELTGSGVIVGSPPYMAPELLNGQKATPASDLWAVGATLYAALEGASPFHRDSVGAVVAAVIYQPVPPSPKAGPLQPLLEQLLCKDPKSRATTDQATALLRAVAEQDTTDPAGRQTASKPKPTVAEAATGGGSGPVDFPPAVVFAGPDAQGAPRSAQHRFAKIAIATTLGVTVATIAVYAVNNASETDGLDSKETAPAVTSATSLTPAVTDKTTEAGSRYEGQSFTFNIPYGWTVVNETEDSASIDTSPPSGFTITIQKIKSDSPVNPASTNGLKAIAQRMISAGQGQSRYRLDQRLTARGGKYTYAWGFVTSLGSIAHQGMRSYTASTVVSCAGKRDGTSWPERMKSCKDYFLVTYQSYSQYWAYPDGCDEIITSLKEI